MNAQEFVAKWRGMGLKERSAAQEHFIDLCRLVGHATPAEADPSGDRFTFEKGASKQRGGQGWADVWYRGRFAWEYKGRHADLDKAYQQLLQYREALENPPLLIVSDLERMVIHTNFTNTVKQVYDLGLDDLLKSEGLERLRAVFYKPEALRAAQTTEQVTRQAAEEFSRLAELLRKWGEEPGRIAHFLIRLLFCLFAEDIGLLPEELFSRLVARTRRNAGAFHQQLQQLFRAMAQGGWFGEHEIAHFNGGLFDDETALELDSEGLDILVRVSGLDWASLEPSILGTLFERSLDPSKRAQLGAHYTSKEDILLIVEPVLMAPWRRRWAEVETKARELAGRRDEAKGSSYTRLHNELAALLTGFAHELAQTRVLDPACGSGNFLYVALRQLLDLEKAVISLAADLGLSRFFPGVSPSQLYGIEVNEYAHELAQTTVWIGYIQWLRENGFGRPAEPILKSLTNIRRMDAILAYDEAGRPVEPEWPAAEVIIGNPPFLGGNKIRQGMGDRYVDALFSLYAGRVPAFADLVCYWFERARGKIEDGEVQRAGLLATQGIRGGANRKVLERIKESGDIFWAQSDRNWILDGATVHVSMVGFDNGSESEHELDGQTVQEINPDLTSDTDLTVAQPLPENVGICFMGPSPKAPFDIEADVAQRMLEAPLNVNGRPNSDVVRPVASAVDLVQKERGKWTIDFGLLPFDEASLYELPFEYVKQNVLPTREKGRRNDYRGNWWQYARPRPEMREALVGLDRFISTPGVAKHRIFVWVSPKVLCNQGTLVFARSDDYFFVSSTQNYTNCGPEVKVLNFVKPKVGSVTRPPPPSRPSPFPGRPAASRPVTPAWRRLRWPPATWWLNGTPG
ncbi:MAG: DNA methyltransferase [Chloroflexota bacterium]